MKETYEKPEVEIIEIDNDVIVTSGIDGGEGGLVS